MLRAYSLAPPIASGGILIEMNPKRILDFYAQPAAMTSLGKHASLVELLPRHVPTLMRVVQGLVIHEFVAAPFYGVAIPEERRNESHIRPVEAMLDRILALDARPLDVARPPDRR